MIQGYKITLVCSCHSRLVYHGITLGDGVSWESRTDDELSGRKYVNRRFNESLDEHGRYAFEADFVANYNDDYDAIMDEAARIERDKSWHPDYGFNVERMDKKRLKRAEAERTPGASEADLLAVAWEDFRRNMADIFQSYDTPANVALITDLAKNEKCSIATAFQLARQSDLLK
jgi:hypothetical protein